MFTVYALHSIKHNKIYIGCTSNLQERMKSHNELSKKGFTHKYRPWSVAYTESFDSKKEALKREKELKSSRGRSFIRTKLAE